MQLLAVQLLDESGPSSKADQRWELTTISGHRLTMQGEMTAQQLALILQHLLEH